MDEDVKKEIDRIKREMEIFRDCLSSVKPIVVEYYSKRDEECGRGYA